MLHPAGVSLDTYESPWPRVCVSDGIAQSTIQLEQEQAQVNHKTEVAGKDFDATVKAAKAHHPSRAHAHTHHIVPCSEDTAHTHTHTPLWPVAGHVGEAAVAR